MKMKYWLMIGAVCFSTAFAAERYQDLQLFAKVLNLIQQYYVEEVDTKKLIYGGIKGMLRELDPHSSFMESEKFSEFKSETSGEFGGFGVEITIQDGVLTVISPIEDTPAFKAGIQPGDKIVEINNESTKGLSLADAALKMRENKKGQVMLGIYREGFDKPKAFTLERATVKLKSAKYTDLDDGYAYVKLTSFIETSAGELDKIFKDHTKKHQKINGLILDVRKNPGGLLDQAVQISDMFLDEGIIVSTIGRDPKEKEIIRAKKQGTMPDFPIIVLIDEYTASASEILAGALQDNNRAVIMGQRSFGKGSVQSVIKLGDGSGLKLTVARYYTPKGRSIQALGIDPDIVFDPIDNEILKKATLKADEGRREQDMEGHLLGDAEVKAVEGKTKKRAKGTWWSTDSVKEKEALSDKTKLLRNDFEVAQAYNNLKAWKIFKSK